MKSVFRLIWKTFLNITIMVIPALFLLLSDSYTRFYCGTIGNFIILYLPAALFTAWIVWKKPCSWFALPTGFLIAPLLYPLWMSLLGRKYSYLFASAFDAMIINLVGYYFIYAFPFAIASLLPTIMRWYRHKKSK